MTTIAFIGAGNMATSIIGGLIKQGTPAEQIIASDPNREALNQLQANYGIHITQENKTVCDRDLVLLAVKPQLMKTVLRDIRGSIRSDSLLLSIAAGITCAQMSQWLEKEQAIVRCMPNTPALVQQGASGLFANDQVSEPQKQLVDQIMSTIGSHCWVEDETLIDTITATSGSGPAYFFLLMEAMVESAIRQGLSAESANALVKQTALGAATLALQSDCDLKELRRRVTSPNGTTEKAIQSFENRAFVDIVDEAMRAAKNRSITLSQELAD